MPSPTCCFPLPRNSARRSFEPSSDLGHFAQAHDVAVAPFFNRQLRELLRASVAAVDAQGEIARARIRPRRPAIRRSRERSAASTSATVRPRAASASRSSQMRIA
jgi:hypothetical protein